MQLNLEQAARAVFAVIAQKVDAGEVAKLRALLPAELRDLWPGQGRGCDKGTARRRRCRSQS